MYIMAGLLFVGFLCHCAPSLIHLEEKNGLSVLFQ